MADTFIVNPSSVSPNEIKADIKAFLDAAPDALKWKDFFATGAGTTLIELVAGLGALINYNVITARRESFIQYAQNNSSVVASAQSMGYSAFRGRNTVLRLSVVPTSTILIPAFTAIGTVKDQDLIVVEDTTFNIGVPVEVLAVIGTVKTESQTITTINPSSFRFTQPNVSEDVRVTLNAVNVETSDRIIDLINEKFPIISNSLGSVDVFYLNLDTFTTRYNIGDVIAIEYVELRSIDFTDEEVEFDYGTFTGFVIESLFKTAESSDSVRVNAPLFNETQFIIRGRDDYMKTFRLLNLNINHTAYKDITAALIDLCYAQKNACLFTDLQLSQFVTQLGTFRPMGLVPPTISHPQIMFLDLDVEVRLLNASGNPSTEVKAILDALEHILEQVISFADIENQIESLSFIKIARIAIKALNRENDKYYRLGKHVKAVPDNGFYYVMHDYAYKSTGVEPVWPLVFPLGQEITDGRIVWQLIAVGTQCPQPTITTWSPNTRYKIGDIVKPTTPDPFTIPNLPGDPVLCAYKAVRLIRKSNADTPAVAASALFIGPLVASATYDGTFFYACNGGTAGNSISLTFNNVDSVQDVVDAWNLANPGNCVLYYPPADGVNIPPAGVFSLSGGAGSSSLTFTAVTAGDNGNNIQLTGDGQSTVSQLVSDYNALHPSNTVGSSGSVQIVPNGTIITLANGANLVSGEPVWPGSLFPPC